MNPKFRLSIGLLGPIAFLDQPQQIVAQVLLVETVLVPARGVLIGRTGRDRATLKIRPPLVFGDQHVDQLATALAATCAALR